MALNPRTAAACCTTAPATKASLPAARVIRALNERVEVRDAPLSIGLDNGPELIADALANWAQSKSIALQHIQPGKPTQNAYVESLGRIPPVEYRVKRFPNLY